MASEHFTLLNKSANALVQSKFGEAATNAATNSASANQYKLVNDAIWLDTLNSYSNRSNHDYNASNAAIVAGQFIELVFCLFKDLILIKTKLKMRTRN